MGAYEVDIIFDAHAVAFAHTLDNMTICATSQYRLAADAGRCFREWMAAICAVIARRAHFANRPGIRHV